MNIVDALKQTKSKKESKPDSASIDFDSIEVRYVKYLPFFMVTFCLYCPLCHLEFQMPMAVQ